MVAESTRSAVAHLARRAGFGEQAAVIDSMSRQGYPDAVEQVVQSLELRDEAAEAVPVPDLTEDGGPAHRSLVRWWVSRMVAAERPAREKLTLLWHDHFATSILKVRSPRLMHGQVRTLYELGGGRFDHLVGAMARDPAMLVWLDSVDNQVGAPNENLARELFELFTLGHGAPADHDADPPAHGGAPYTEIDVAEAARALTGWWVNRRAGTAAVAPARHDGGVKTVLGVTGRLGTEDVVAAACASPACAPHVVSRLWSRLARPGGPDDPVVVELAEPFAEDFDVAALLRRLFLHDEFLAPASRHGLVKTPVELVVGNLRTLGCR